MNPSSRSSSTSPERARIEQDLRACEQALDMAFVKVGQTVAEGTLSWHELNDELLNAPNPSPLIDAYRRLGIAVAHAQSALREEPLIPGVFEP